MREPVTEGSECGGAERKEAEAYGGEDAGGESWEAGSECRGAEAGEEGPQVPGVAGSRGKEGMVRRVRRDHVPYDVLEKQGFLETTEGT